MVAVSFGILTFLLLLGIALTYVTVRIAFTESQGYRELQSLLAKSDFDVFGGLVRSVSGNIRHSPNGDKHFLIQAGLKLHKKDDTLHPQFRISDEAVRSLLEPKR